MKKLCSTIMVMMLLLICNIASADIFINDDGTQLTISWSKVTDAFYYDVEVRNLTSPTTAPITGCVFDPYITVNGLIYHNIYSVTVKAFDNDGDYIENVGQKYITFALDESSGNCICNCDCPNIPKKVFYGLISDDWWTGIAINNASTQSQTVVINIGTISKTIIIPSHFTEAFLLSDIIEDTTPKRYPITYETDSPDIGITVLMGDGVNVCSQN